MTITEAARTLGVSRKVVYRLIDEGELHVDSHPLYKRGGPHRIPVADVEAVQRRLRASHPPTP